MVTKRKSLKSDDAKIMNWLIIAFIAFAFVSVVSHMRLWRRETTNVSIKSDVQIMKRLWAWQLEADSILLWHHQLSPEFHSIDTAELIELGAQMDWQAAIVRASQNRAR